MNQSTTCPMCSARFDTEDELHKHKMAEHANADEHAGHDHETAEFKCPMCGTTFATKQELDEHAHKAHGQHM